MAWDIWKVTPTQDLVTEKTICESFQGTSIMTWSHLCWFDSTS